MNVQLCNTCGERKPLDQYGLRTTKKGERVPMLHCRECHRIRGKKWRENNPEKAERNSRRSKLKRNYGLTLEDFDKMMDAQGGVCAICGEPPDRAHLDVDHCHETDVVRGLLCQSCNKGLGSFKDDCGKLESAIDYLKEPPCPFG